MDIVDMPPDRPRPSPLLPVPPVPRIGFMQGAVRVPEDFDTLHSEEIARLFEGEEA